MPRAQVVSQLLIVWASGGWAGIGWFDYRAGLCRRKEGRMGLGLRWDLRGPEAPPAWKSDLGSWFQLCRLPAL